MNKLTEGETASLVEVVKNPLHNYVRHTGGQCGAWTNMCCCNHIDNEHTFTKCNEDDEANVLP